MIHWLFNGLGIRIVRRRLIWLQSVKLCTQRCQPGSQARTEEAIISDLDEPFGQHMLQETADEFFGRYDADLGFPGFGGSVAKGHVRIRHLDDAIVADGDAENVGSQILQCRNAISNHHAMHHPGLSLDLCGDIIVAG